MTDTRALNDEVIQIAAACYRARTAHEDHWFHIQEAKPFHKSECRCDICDAWREVNGHGKAHP